MIIFKDEDKNTFMSFLSPKGNQFYIELGKVGEEEYANCIELENDEVKHLIGVLTEHLKTQK